MKDEVVKLDISDFSFFYEDNLLDDKRYIREIIKKIFQISEEYDTSGYFDDWFLKFSDKEELLIPKGIIKAVTFSDSSQLLTDFGLYIIKTFFEDCFTLKKGLQSLTESLVENSEIKNESVQKIKFQGKKVVEVVTDVRTINTRSDTVVSTAPPGTFRIEGNKRLTQSFDKIRYNGCAVVYFRVKERFPERSDYIFFPEKEKKVSVIEQYDIGGEEFIGVLIPHQESVKKEEILDYLHVFLSDIFDVEFKRNIIETFYEDWPKGLPIVDGTHLNALKELKSLDLDNMYFAGDFFCEYPSMDSAAKTGIEVAERVGKSRS